MNKEKFIYVVYIRSTPEKVWNALREPALTRQYWARENVSDWQPGSKWEHRGLEAPHAAAIVGEVIESVAQKHMVWSWAFPEDAANKTKHTRVTYEIEPVADMVRLTVTHDELEPGSKMQLGITGGWPLVLSSLKSFLETGKGIDILGLKRAAG